MYVIHVVIIVCYQLLRQWTAPARPSNGPHTHTTQALTAATTTTANTTNTPAGACHRALRPPHSLIYYNMADQKDSQHHLNVLVQLTDEDAITEYFFKFGESILKADKDTVISYIRKLKWIDIKIIRENS